MYTLKSIFKRGALLSAAGALLVAAVLPGASAFADSLNPLTERSLLLSSSAPGFMNSDGSGNSETALNAVNQSYAPPGSGPNGQKSGETFKFKVSTDSTQSGKDIKAFTLQYCTSAAGKCQAPGDNAGDGRTVYPTSGAFDLPANSDTSAWVSGPSTRDTNAEGLLADPKTSDLDVVYSSAVLGTDFTITVDGTPVTTGWTLTTSNKEDLTHSGELTGKNNFITLTYTGGGAGAQPLNGQIVQLKFNASTTDYITNPGSGSFFVKINTYNSATPSDHVPGGANNIDGGVTVANVMTDSIHITTKVLETMSFSVGTVNPDTQNTPHGICDAIDSPDNNRLNLGNPDAEYSLETGRAWDVNSYWRLSSNSSGGATVYYSGNTLANTVGDEISQFGATATNSHPGTKQFGLALVNAGLDTMDTLNATTFPAEHVTPTITPLTVGTEYNQGAGPISEEETTDNAKFAFLKSSLLVPELIASNNTDVISCATAKVRYVANISPDTPAGVYTTKINYLAAPQY